MQESLKSTASHYKGIHAELSACDYFAQHGYKIIAKRYRPNLLSEGFGEIDLIVTHNQILVFVEVKTRPTINDCLHSISKRQQQRIILSAEYFISDNFSTYQNHDVRFDIIAIDANGAMTHLENAFGDY